MKFPNEIKEMVAERAGWRCEICGKGVTSPQIHHRRPRGMGGTKRKNSASPANALFLDMECHTDVEKNRYVAIVNGWVLSQSDDPSEKKFRHHEGWKYLTDEGGYLKVTLSTEVEV